jgi:methyltransferase
MQTATFLFLAFIIVQRLSELVIAKVNTKRLLARGAYEVGAGHYPVMVAMHSIWIGCLLFFARWTTRIIILPEPLVVRGPFRFLKHPNYTLVVAEIIVAPMVLNLVWVAVVFTVLNAAMLWVRIGVEGRALAPLRDPS